MKNDIHMIAIFNRDLTNDEINLLSENPWQLFKPTTWRDRLMRRIKDKIYFMLWRTFPESFCAWIYGEKL